MKRRGSQLGHVADALEDLEAAVGQLAVGLFGVGDGDDRVAVAPDDQQRQRLGQVEAVEGGDALALGADDRAQGREEGLAALGIGERGVAAGDLGDVGAGAHAQHPQTAAEQRAGLAADARRWRAMKRSAPGSAAARRTGLTSGPRPPLETSTRRSTISGNW